MKILFSADWHIKLGQKNVPREWQTNRYNMLFDKLHDLERKVDIHIIGGDIFDTLPKPDEIALFFKFIAKCEIPTYIYDGNHEATRKGKTFLTFFKDIAQTINENVYIIDGIETHSDIDFIPYTHIKKFKPSEFKNKICCTHVRGNIPPHVIEEIDLSLFDRWNVVLAGDLHAHSNSQRNIIYPGSPLAITFHRNPVENGVIIYDTSDKASYDSSKICDFIPLGLPQLIRKTVECKDDIIKTEYDHTIYEVTGNILELSDIDSSSDLIDKKLIKRQSDTVLNLQDLSVEQELEQYFELVVGLPKSDIVDIIKVFNDYYKQSDME